MLLYSIQNTKCCVLVFFKFIYKFYNTTTCSAIILLTSRKKNITLDHAKLVCDEHNFHIL